MIDTERVPSGEPFKVGDKIRMAVPPPLTWWDNLLWRFFRIERKRPRAMKEFVVTYTTDRKST